VKDFIRVMKALSDPNRVKVVKMLQHKEMCVCEIQFALGLAQPTVSKHLKVLGNLKHWLGDEPDIRRLAATLPTIQREIIIRKKL
jgi:ArsR family transcriptional regulator